MSGEGSDRSVENKPVKNELIGVQLLRGWAAATVALAHLVGHLNRYSQGLDTGIFPAYMGVDIFFTISGFIMIYTSHGRFGGVAAARDFIIRRLIRVAPLYWIFTFLIAISLLISPESYRTAKFDWSSFFASLVFLPHRQESGLIKPLLSLGWTLNYEILFYLLFATSLLFARRIGLPLLFLTIGAMVLYGWVVGVGPTPILFWTSSVIAEFLFGVTVGIAYLKLGTIRVRFGYWLLLAALALALAMALTAWDAADASSRMPRMVKWGIPSTAMLILATIVLPDRAFPHLTRLGEKIGDSSYALYLSHKFLFGAATLLWAKVIGFGAIPYWVPTAILLLASLLGGYLVHRIVEKPVIGLINSKMLRRETRTQAVADSV